MEQLVYSRMESPVGPLWLGLSGQGLAVVEFARTPLEPVSFAGRVQWLRDDQALEPAATQLREYFEGSRREFTLQLDLRGPEFHLRCWHGLLEIPYGHTLSYAELARRVGSPQAFRAVGQANHHNPIAIIVPCHRVITSARELGGYGGGLETKEFLLTLEGARFRNHRVEPPQMRLLMD